MKNIELNYSIEKFYPKKETLTEITAQEMMDAVKENGMILNTVPKAMRTEELCLAAVRQNGLALVHVPKKILTEYICLEAIRNRGNIYNVPPTFRTKDLYLEAVKYKGEALWSVPEEYKSKDMCLTAVKQDGLSLQFVPDALRTEEFYIEAVKQTGLALQHVPEKDRIKSLCSLAVENNPLALKYLPKRMKTLSISRNAVQEDWKAFLYAPDRMYTLEACINVLERALESGDVFFGSMIISSYVTEIAGRLPKIVEDDKRIIELLRKLNVREIRAKRFDKNSKQFIVKEYLKYKYREDERSFDTFQEFYYELNGDLADADLQDYDFSGIDLRNYDIENIYINSEVLIKQNLYDDSFYKAYIDDVHNDTELLPSEQDEEIGFISYHDEDDLVPEEISLHKSQKFYYISDIHLDRKLEKKFPKYATKQEVTFYIKNLVKRMLETVTDERSKSNDYLLIAGDTSYHVESLKIFYNELIKHWQPEKIVVVLGNHELWACDWSYYLEVDVIIDKYRKLFDELGILFLHNNLLVSNGREVAIASEEQLLAMDSSTLRSVALECPIMILGGLGFSGLCSEYNATNKLYRQAIKTLKEDLNQTERFGRIYKKVEASLVNRPVIVLTHTPRDNWTNEDHNAHWIYVSGHTHKNMFQCSEGLTIYSDNQIGYYNTSIGLKHFRVSNNYDIFKYYKDGIYTITREDYLHFNRGKEIAVTCNRTDGKILMLKREDLYCFFFRRTGTGKLFLLNGGAIKKLEHQDIQYYFDNMEYYSKAMKMMYHTFRQALESISELVKKIGGDGYIHGCIVDIDFYNHIYINQADGKVTPYYAKSIIDKHIYPDLKSLLLKRRKDLYDVYMKLLKESINDTGLSTSKDNNTAESTSTYVPETDIYKASRIMRSIQYLWETNVIRIWNDEVTKGYLDINGGINISKELATKSIHLNLN